MPKLANGPGSIDAPKSFYREPIISLDMKSMPHPDFAVLHKTLSLFQETAHCIEASIAAFRNGDRIHWTSTCSDETRQGAFGREEIHRSSTGPNIHVTKDHFGNVTGVERKWFNF